MMYPSKHCLIFLIITIEIATSRVFYIDTPKKNYYNIHSDQNDIEQASRDLDMTFSAGDLDETVEQNEYHPLSKKVAIYPSAERSISELNGHFEAPIVYQIPSLVNRKIIYEPAYFHPEINHKPVKWNNNNNPQKGEVVLELRVIANSNNNNDNIEM